MPEWQILTDVSNSKRVLRGDSMGLPSNSNRVSRGDSMGLPSFVAGSTLFLSFSFSCSFVPEWQIETPTFWVAKGGKRPRIKNKWPAMTKEIMKSSWMPSPIARPSMENICRMIKLDLQELETEEHIASRIECIANISRHSSSRFYNFDQAALDESRHEFSFQLGSLDEINEN